MPLDRLNLFYRNTLFKDNRHFEVETWLYEQGGGLSIHSVFSPEHDVILTLKQCGRLYFTEDEIKNSEKVAIVTTDLGKSGDTITVEAIGDLKIIGVFRYYYAQFHLYSVQFISKSGLYSKYYVFRCIK